MIMMIGVTVANMRNSLLHKLILVEVFAAHLINRSTRA